jgi:hypothetical protein
MDPSTNNLQILQTFQLKHLRALCIKYGISASGTKKILIDRIHVFTQTLQSPLENLGDITHNTDNNVTNNEEANDPFMERVYLESLKTLEEEEAKRKIEIIQQNLKRQDEIVQQNLEYEESVRMDTVKHVTTKLKKGDYEGLENKQIETFLTYVQIEFSSDMELNDLLYLVPDNYINTTEKRIDSNFIDKNLKEYVDKNDDSEKNNEKEETLSIDELRRARLKYYS